VGRCIGVGGGWGGETTIEIEEEGVIWGRKERPPIGAWVIQQRYAVITHNTVTDG
jgi:hypothetical protein